MVSVSSNTIQFTADLNGDGDVDESGENVTYALDTQNNQVTRKGTASDTPMVLTDNIQGLSFTYYDSDDNTTATAADVRRVTIALTAATRTADPLTRQDRTWSLTCDVTPRNLAF